jgi:hypothetical protein
MSTTQVSIRLGVEGQAEIKRAFDEVGKAGQDSFRNVDAAMDSAGAATDRETQRLQRLAQAAKQAQAAEAAQRNFNAALGVERPAAGSARESARCSRTRPRRRRTWRPAPRRCARRSIR